jgi:hypothetical protein
MQGKLMKPWRFLSGHSRKARKRQWQQTKEGGKRKEKRGKRLLVLTFLFPL